MRRVGMIIIGIDPQKLVYTPARSSLPRIVGSTRWRFEATLGRLPSPTQVAVGFDERRWAVEGPLIARAAVLAWGRWSPSPPQRRRVPPSRPSLTILALAATLLWLYDLATGPQPPLSGDHAAVRRGRHQPARPADAPDNQPAWRPRPPPAPVRDRATPAKPVGDGVVKMGIEAVARRALLAPAASRNETAVRG